MVIAVFVFVRQGETLLLVRQVYGGRFWSLPGGVVETGETIEQAAMREVREETGLEIAIRRVVGLYSKPEENALAITLEAEITGGSLMPDHEIAECGFFAFEAIPQPVREHFHQRLSDFRSGQVGAYLRTQ